MNESRQSDSPAFFFVLKQVYLFSKMSSHFTIVQRSEETWQVFERWQN